MTSFAVSFTKNKTIHLYVNYVGFKTVEQN